MPCWAHLSPEGFLCQLWASFAPDMWDWALSVRLSLCIFRHHPGKAAGGCGPAEEARGIRIVACLLKSWEDLQLEITGRVGFRRPWACSVCALQGSRAPWPHLLSALLVVLHPKGQGGDLHPPLCGAGDFYRACWVLRSAQSCSELLRKLWGSPDWNEQGRMPRHLVGDGLGEQWKMDLVGNWGLEQLGRSWNPQMCLEEPPHQSLLFVCIHISLEAVASASGAFTKGELRATGLPFPRG